MIYVAIGATVTREEDERFSLPNETTIKNNFNGSFLSTIESYGEA